MKRFAAGATDAPSDGEGGLQRGARTYERLLVGAGGKELEAIEGAADRPAVYAALYASPAYSLNVPPLRVPRLAVNLTAARVSGGIDGARPCGFDARRHSLFLTPAGVPADWRKESPSRHLGIYFQPTVFEDGEGDAPRLLEAPALLNAVVPGLGELADHLAEELQSPAAFSVEAADSLTRLLLIRLARHLRRRSIDTHALTRQSIAQLRDYILAHLSERVLVADLAKQVGLSPNYFALCFAEQTGLSPHRFVLTLRIERAAQMLGRSEARLADIAHDCGFSSQQHLNNAMRRHLGTTPSRYRALYRR